VRESRGSRQFCIFPVFTPTEMHIEVSRQCSFRCVSSLLHRVESTPKNVNERLQWPSLCSFSRFTLRGHTEDCWILSLILLSVAVSVDKMDNTHNEDPDKSKNEKSKVEAAAAAVIILEKNHDIGRKAFNFAGAVRNTGIFETEELTRKMVAQVQQEVKKQGHREKTASRPSIGGLQTRDEAMTWAATRLQNTETKKHFAPENYKMALDNIGIDVTVDAIKAKKKKLKRQERENKGGIRPYKRPCHSTADSSLEERTTATVPLISAVASSSTRAGSPAATSNVYSSLEDRPTAMAPHSAVASTPCFQGFDEHHCTTPQTALQGRRLDPIFEGQDVSNPSQDFLVQQQEPSRVYSEYDLKQKALIIETFRTK
jgi:hypothetical protein